MKEVFARLFRDMLSASVAAEVLSVDRASDTCDVRPLDGGAEILDVRLRTDDGTDGGTVVYPCVGSAVVVSPVNNSRTAFYVAMFSRADEIRAEIGSAKMAMDKDGFALEKGTDSLKGLLAELVEQLLKVYAPKDVPGITALKTKINNLFK